MGSPSRDARKRRIVVRCFAVALPSLLSALLIPPPVANALPAAAPSLSVTPASSLGSPIALSTGSMQRISVSNAQGARSTGALRVSLGTNPATSEFSISSDSCTHFALGPGRSCQVSVAYGPTAPARVQTATLTVQSPAPGSPVISAYLWVRPLVDQPIANLDIYHVTQGTTLTVPAPGPLANDSDPDGDAISMVVTNGPLYGDLTFSADGSFSYRSGSEPPGDGIDSFRYAAFDGFCYSNPTLVDIVVDPAIT
jgi:hypothetical protein